MIINDVYIVLNFNRTYYLQQDYFEQGFTKVSIVVLNLVITAYLINNLYYMILIFLIIYDTKENNDFYRDGKRIKNDSIDPTYMWQVRLGHI